MSRSPTLAQQTTPIDAADDELTPTLVSVHGDLERALELVAAGQALDALELCSAMMETICTHIEPLGLSDIPLVAPMLLVEDDSNSKPAHDASASSGTDDDYRQHSRDSETAATESSEQTNPSRDNLKRKASVAGIHDSPSMHSSTSASAGHDDADPLVKIEQVAHDATKRTRTSPVVLSLDERIDFWEQINKTWLLVIQSAGDVSCRKNAVANEPLAQSATHRSTRAHPAPEQLQHQSANLSPQKLDQQDWIAFRNFVLDCGNILELYGLVDYTMGFAELEIVEAIHNQIMLARGIV